MASLDDFFVPTYIPTAVEIERANRIRLAVYAYAYEYESTSLISDGEFDELSKKIDLTIYTGNSKMDKWFKKNFEPDTGMWIHKPKPAPLISSIRDRKEAEEKEPIKSVGSKSP